MLWNQNRVPTETFEGFHKSVVPEHTRFVPMTEWISYKNFSFLDVCMWTWTLNESIADVDEDETETIAGVP